MLYQLHHQFKDGHTEMQAQKDIETEQEFRAWIEEVKPKYPLPDGAMWMACNEESEHFVMAVPPTKPDVGQMWDVVQNKDFRSDCILGFFCDHDPSDESGLSERFGMLTMVKNRAAALNGWRYEEYYGRWWRHFRPATTAEVEERTYVYQGQGRACQDEQSQNPSEPQVSQTADCRAPGTRSSCGMAPESRGNSATDRLSR